MANVEITKTFQFELVSPEKILVSEQAQMVEIPGEAGNFAVLANHAPLLSSIRPGVVTVTGEDGSEKKIFVAGGFADVNDNVCSVLAEQAINVNEFDKDALTKELTDLKDDLSFAKGDIVKTESIQKNILLTEAKIASVA